MSAAATFKGAVPLVRAMRRRALAAAAAALAVALAAALVLAPRGAGASLAPAVGVSVLVDGVPQPAPAYFDEAALEPLALALFPTENNRFAVIEGGLRALWARYPDPYRTYWGVAGHSARAWYANLRPPPFMLVNSTGILLSVTGTLDPAEYFSPFGVSESYRKLMTATRFSRLETVMSWRDPLRRGIVRGGIPVVNGPSELARQPDWGEPISIVYQFYFKADQVFTVNFVKVFYAWLFNSEYGRVNVTATDGSTVLFDPMGDNVPIVAYIVVGDGQASFSRDAYRVAHEIARAEPAVQVKGGLALSAVFVFDRDVTVTEAAVYVKLGGGKEVMLLYYVYPQPVTVRAGQPFVVSFPIVFPLG